MTSPFLHPIMVAIVVVSWIIVLCMSSLSRCCSFSCVLPQGWCCVLVKLKLWFCWIWLLRCHVVDGMCAITPHTCGCWASLISFCWLWWFVMSLCCRLVILSSSTTW